MSIIYIDSYRFAVASIPWTPAQISTEMWFDATDAATINQSGGLVSEWRDKSGNTRNAVQGSVSLQPTYTASAINGKPAITFAPEGGTAQDRLDVTAATFTQNNLTVFAIARKPSSSGNTRHRYSRVAAFWISSSSTSDFASTNGWIPAFIPQQDSFGGIAPPSVVSFRNNAIISVQGTSYGVANIIGSTINGSQGILRLNGVETTGTTSITNINANRFSIGGSPTGTDSEMYGDIAEIVVTTALSASNQQRMEGYLAHKWGLSGNLPATHPYKSAAPTV